VENSTDCFSCFHHKRCRFIRNGKLGFDGAWRWQRLDFYDVLIVDRSIHGLPLQLEVAQHNEMYRESLHGHA
jgi:hypothetical protein